MVNKGATPYCVLKRFPILNPEIGCSRQMFKSELKTKSKFLKAEEIVAYTEAFLMNSKEHKNEDS
jgi:hypothetical protein